jgi:predicted small secreted protein
MRALGRRGAFMESHMSRKLTFMAFAALIGASSFLAACNTVEGAGRDVQAAGQGIEQSAQESNDGNPNTP